MKTFATIDCEIVLVDRYATEMDGLMAFFGGDYKDTQLRKIVQIGVCVVDNGAIVDSKTWFVKPNESNTWNDAKYPHTITQKDTESADTFPVVWEKVKEFVGNRELFACNAKNAESGYIRDEFEYYGINEELPVINEGKEHDGRFDILCKLNGVENKGEHDAMNDAIALAEYMLKENKGGYELISAENFNGKNIVLHGIHTNNLVNRLAECGVVVKQNVSKKVDYLVCANFDDCTKIRKAKELGIPIIGLEKLIAAY